jgi:AraC family transcriptional regulator
MEGKTMSDNQSFGDEIQLLFEEREVLLHHFPYRWEQLLLRYIGEGNLPMVERLFNQFNQGERKGSKLSDNELRQAQYFAVILTYAASRAAIQAGMFEADALNRGDAFIYNVDKQISPQVVLDMVGESIIGWTNSIQEMKSHKPVSQAIRACQEYMYKHLHSRVSLEELARVSGFSVPYLSVLFKKEVGENISTYLLHLKIKTAQDMLLNTKLSTKEIGFYLNFSSQSYFIRCFKGVTGVTPREFRKKEMAPRNAS